MVRAVVFWPFVSFLESEGHGVKRTLEAAKILPDNLRSEDDLLPLQRGCNFLSRVRRAEGIENLGLEVGCGMSLTQFGLLGGLMRQALTLHDLIRRLQRWIPAVSSGARLWLEASGRRESVNLCLRHSAGLGREIADAYALFLLIDAIRVATGPDWRPRGVWLDAAAGKNLEIYEALSEARTERRVQHIGIEIPRRLLASPVNSNVKPAGDAADLRDEANFLKAAPPEDLAGSVCCLLKTHFGSLMPTIQEIAEVMGVSVRTFQRRLDGSRLAFSDLLDRVRYDEAVRRLEDSAVKISEIAHDLGYSDPAHFTHSFRRWTGITPAVYREQRNRTEG